MLAVSALTVIPSMGAYVHPSTTSPLVTERQLELLSHFSRVRVYYPGGNVHATINALSCHAFCHFLVFSSSLVRQPIVAELCVY